MNETVWSLLSLGSQLWYHYSTNAGAIQ